MNARARRAIRPIATAVAVAAMFAGAACGAPEAPGGGGTGNTAAPTDAASVPDKPSKPVTLDILDVAGNLQLTQAMIDDFVANNKDVVSRVTYQKATGPETAGKIKAQQDGGNVQTDLVLTGNDGLSAGIDQGLWVPIVKDFGDRLKDPMANYLEPAAEMQKLAQDQGVVVTYYPSGPLLEYDPKQVPQPPTTAQGLLDWAKANPGKFMYARPANSGPGRTLLMGLPYILGDKDPKDPVNGWEKTWKFLAELDKYIEFYPSGTADTMKNLGNGSVGIIASTTGWYVNPRVLGTVPKEVKVGAYEGFTWVTDAHYAVIPKGVSADNVSAILLLLQWMLKPDQQAKAYDKGFFYPGPAIKDVTIDMAPADSQQAIKDFGDPSFEKLIADNPKATPLEAKDMVAAFDKWDREIGGSKVKKQ